MENRGNSYRIRSEEKPCRGQSWVPELQGAVWGGLVPGRCSRQSGGAGRLRGSSSLGRRAHAAPPSCSLLLAVEKADFLPKTAPTWDMQSLLPLPAKSETLSLSSVLRLGFSGLFLALGSSASNISIASIHLFSTPSLLCCRRFPGPSPSVLPTAPAATAAPLNGPRRRIIATAHLHSSSSQSCPAPPPPNRSSAGARLCAATLERAAPGETPSRGCRE